MFQATTRTASDVFVSVKRQMGDEAQVVITDADIIRWINDGQREIVTNNQSLNLTKAVASVTPGRSEYPIQGDPAFSGVILINSIHYKGSRLQGVPFQQAEEMMLTNKENAGGVPSIWYSVAGVVHLYPIPEESIPGGLSIYFTKAPPRITLETETLGIPDSYFNALVEYVMSKAYELEENAQMSQMKTEQFEKSLNIQQNRTVDEQAEFPTIRPDPMDGW